MNSHVCLSGSAWCSGCNPCEECLLEQRHRVLAFAARGAGIAHPEQWRAMMEGYMDGWRRFHEAKAQDPELRSRLYLTDVSGAPPARPLEGAPRRGPPGYSGSPGYGGPPPGYGGPPSPGYAGPPGRRPGYGPPDPHAGYGGGPPPGYGAAPPGYGAPPGYEGYPDPRDPRWDEMMLDPAMGGMGAMGEPPWVRPPVDPRARPPEPVNRAPTGDPRARVAQGPPAAPPPQDMNEAIARQEREARRSVATSPTPASAPTVEGAPLDASHVVASARVIPERGEVGDDKPPPNGAVGG